MGSEVCADEQVIVECGNWKLISKVVTVGAGDEEEDEAASASAAAGPATPDPVENGEHHNLNLNLSLNHHHFSPPPSPWGNHSGLQTPKETLFDSFAPASDKFLLAPHHRKYREESRNHVVRRLDFTKDLTNTWSCKEEEDEEERLFEIVYGTIMDTILAEQQQQVKEAAADGSGGGGGGGTPKSAPFLNGIAETCPAAPIKSARKHRFIDREICKKLDF